MLQEKLEGKDLEVQRLKHELQLRSLAEEEKVNLADQMDLTPDKKVVDEVVTTDEVVKEFSEAWN